ncbi:MAG: PA0069 family radical SAM protein [Bacteroidia bacterium]|nr:PA0069 family radical SAM protein [Bacteroidia bacterium]
MKGRASVNSPDNKFLKEKFQKEILWAIDEFEEKERVETKVIEVFPKTIINEVKSMDLSFMYSMNPYQGCEHGCAYCYARPTHEYWGYNAGIDFESVILVKKNAAEILDKELRKPNRVVSPIVISGNTDCYQPIEKQYQITRSLLQVCLDFKHPVSIITKNALVVRDLDLLISLSAYNLVKVMISITGVDEKMRMVLEPRTSTYSNRFKALKILAEHNIPCGVMVAPIIPGLNDKEIPAVLKLSSENGARFAGMTIVRLNDNVEPVFVSWLERNFPDKKDKVLSLIRSCHNGNLSDNRTGKRFSGDGNIASAIHQLFRVCYQKYFRDEYLFEHNCTLFNGQKSGDLIQGSLF